MSKYTEDLVLKRIQKGGGLPPIMVGIPKDKQDEIQMIMNEQWLDGYKTAKKKFKEKYKG